MYVLNQRVYIHKTYDCTYKRVYTARHETKNVSSYGTNLDVTFDRNKGSKNGADDAPRIPKKGNAMTMSTTLITIKLSRSKDILNTYER